MEIAGTLVDMLGSSAITAELEYSFDGSNYLSWEHSGTSSLQHYYLEVAPVDKIEQIFFRMALSYNGVHFGYDNDAEISFIGPPEDVYYGLDAYSSVLIDWGD